MRMFRRAEGYKEEELIRSAIDHLEAAQYLFGVNPSWFDSAGYLSHLGLELLLKACLLTLCHEFPDEHSLRKLTKQLADNSFYIKFRDNNTTLLQKLDKLYDLRYPSPSDPVNIGNEDWNVVQQMIIAIVDRMPDSLRDCFERIRRPVKGDRVLMRKPMEKEENI